MLRDVARRFAARVYKLDTVAKYDDVFWDGMCFAIIILAEELKRADPGFSTTDFLVLCGLAANLMEEGNPWDQGVLQEIKSTDIESYEPDD